MFDLVKGLGIQENPLSLEMSNKNIAKGDVVYYASGYVSNAYASVTCALIAGVAQAAKDNSGGSAGDYELLVETNPLMLYKTDTAGTMAKAYVGNNAALASASTITSASSGTDITGVAKILKYISTSKALVRLNMTGEADT